MWMKNFVVLSGIATTQNFNSISDGHPSYNDIVKQKFQHVNRDKEKIHVSRNFHHNLCNRACKLRKKKSLYRNPLHF